MIKSIAEQMVDAGAAGQRMPPFAGGGLCHNIDVLDPDCHRCLVFWLGSNAVEEKERDIRRAIADGWATIIFALGEGPAGLSLRLEYRADLLSRRLARQVANHLLRAMLDMERNLDLPVERCQILSANERRRLLHWARGPERQYPLEGGLKALFEARVRDRPETVALMDEEVESETRSITYRELNSLANDISRKMLSAGVAPGDVVAIKMSRSINYVGALIAAIKVSAVVLPIDESYPDDYVRRMVQETATVAICVSPKDAERAVAFSPSVKTVPVDWQGKRLAREASEPISAPSQMREASSGDAALHQEESSGSSDCSVPTSSGYDEANSRFLIMYTSGSTGRPKGVVHCQRQVLNRLYWMWETYPIAADELFCQRSPVSVMPSVWEFLGGLLWGVPTVLAPASVTRNPALLAGFIARHRPTRFTILPSLLMRLLERDSVSCELASLRLVTIGGEMFSPELYCAFRERLPSCLFVEDYGCTEVNTIWHYALGSQEKQVSALPGGRPISNLSVYIVDRFGQLAPRGAIGELAVAGGSLAVDYVDAPDEYAKRFIVNHIDQSAGPLLYQPGDLGFVEPAGSIKLAGRADHQLKVRGMRVEPSELETVMLQHEAVAECCAVSRSDDREGGELVLFLVPRGSARVSATECRSYLAERLPSFMIPTRVLIRDRLPTTLSGKRDRRALTVAATTALVESDDSADPALIRSLLAEVLGQDPADIEDNVQFQMLGLDSLRLLTFAERLCGLGLPVSAATLFDHCCMSALVRHLRNYQPLPGKVHKVQVGRASRLEDMPRAPLVTGRDSDIAVIGMAGRFPGAETVDELWSNLAEGRDSVTEIPAERWRIADHYDADAAVPNRSLSKWGALLLGVEEFDPLLFRISPADAALMDPQLRIGLQEAWRAFEDAGYSPAALEDMSVGIFAGLRKGDFETLLDRTKLAPDKATILGNDPSMFAARLALRMNLKGPSLTIDSACSSSLSAVHLACRNLLEGECELAIAGGACIIMSVDHYIATSKLGIFSPTGKCRAFDAAADGFVQGEGAAFVVLKQLEHARRDGDNIHAVIKGSALGHDGRTNGLGVPSARAQADVQRQVYNRYDIDPRTITLVEAHGTGTPIGDQIEIEALARSIGDETGTRAPCAVGSIKTNIGHLTAAAGVVGLIKTILCLRHRQIPPSLNFLQPNPSIPFSDTPFYVSDRLHDWLPPAGVPRRAAINSFGLSGTNVHCVVEEAPEPPDRDRSDAPAHLILLSAQTPDSLARQASALREFVGAHGPSLELRDVAYTLLVGRERLPCLRTIIAADCRELERLLLPDSNSGPDDGCSVPPVSVDEATLVTRSERIVSELRSGRPSAERYRECLVELATLIQRGLRPDRIDLYPPETARRISLPTYCFERQPCWPARELLLNPQPALSAASDRQGAASTHSLPLGEVQDDGELLDHIRHEVGSLLDIPASSIDAAAGLDAYGYDSMAAVDLKARLEARLGREIPIALLVDAPSLNELADRLAWSAPGEAGSRPAALAEQDRAATAADEQSEEFALTPVQAGYLFGRMADGVGAHTYLEFEMETLDVARLSRAWNRLVERHPMLRAEITPSGRQRVLPRVPVYEMAAHHLRDERELGPHLRKMRARLANRLYDLGRWPLFAIEATICAYRSAIVHVSMDSSIADWASADIIYREWHALYQRPEIELSPLEMTFRDYCSQLAVFRASQDGRRQAKYWRDKLEACPNSPDLGAAAAPTGTGPTRFQRSSAVVEADEWASLKQRAAAIGVFPTNLVLACLAQTLAPQQGDVPFAIVQTHAHRRSFSEQIGSIVGPFTSTSVVIAEQITGRPLEDVAARMNAQATADLQNRDVCAASVLGDIARETGHRPRLAVVFTPRLGIGRRAEPSAPSWLDHVSYARAQTPGIALECRVSEAAERLQICWDIAESSLPVDRAATLLEDFRLRLKAAAASPRRTAGAVPETAHLTALQRAYLAEAVRVDKRPWAEGTVYQEFEVGHFDLGRFRQALRRLTDLEPTLTAELSEKGALRLNRDRCVTLTVNDLVLARDSSTRLANIRTRMLATQAANTRIRAQVSLLGGARARVHLAVDMIIADGFSTLLLYVKLFQLYRQAHVDGSLVQSAPAPAAGRAPSDPVHWEQRLLDVPPGPKLPRPKPHAAGGLDAELPVARLATDLDIWEGLRERAAQRSLLPDSVLIAALNLVLAGWNEADRAFKTILALTSRHLVAPAAPLAIADFTALSWVSEPVGERSFAQRAAEVQELIAADLQHRGSFPMEAMSRLGQGALAQDRSQHCVVYTGALSEPPLRWPQNIKLGYGTALTPGVDLDCFVHNLDGRLTVHWDYRRAAIAEAAIAAMFDAYVTLLERLATDDLAWGAIQSSFKPPFVEVVGRVRQGWMRR
ncbi:AMP-binding protein [Bradyrhizobium sp. ISRA442]|uniref:beta-ketoacyl synthase N-terminal-like domain-containing protein n=1 Tax=Bradyrhizobium sp. ISRA442 TaxID=2866197 RepID=UPI00311B1968